MNIKRETVRLGAMFFIVLVGIWAFSEAAIACTMDMGKVVISGIGVLVSFSAGYMVYSSLDKKGGAK